MPEPLDPEEQRAGERLGQVIGGKWRLDGLLGVGGMAAVYAAESPAGEKAAIKVLHPEMSRRKDLRHRFMQEGTAATRVGHPGAVSVLEHAEEPDGTAYLVLELLQGESLSTLVRRPGGLPKAKLLQVLDEVLDVLAAAHARGIIHRDLKPDNLFVTTDGHIKVLDFGIARVLDDVPGAYKTRTGMTLGTMPYMSPEQALGKRGQLDGRADLFSLGAMTFRILAGRNVHQADTDAELLVAMASKPAPPLASVASHVDPDLCAVVDLALAFSRDSRYPDAATMQRDVQALIAGKAPPHATRVRQARDSATRTDLPAPQIAFPAGAPVTSRVPAASGDDAATIVDQPLTAPPPLSRVPSASRGAPAAPTRVDPPPEAAPPSSLRAMVMPVVDPSDLAPTIQLPARELPPPPSRSIEPTLASAPATPKSRAPLVWAAILVAALAVIGVSAYLLLAPAEPEPLGRQPSSRADTAGLPDPTTKVAAASLSPAGTPTGAQAAAPASPPTAAPAPAARTRGKSRRH